MDWEKAGVGPGLYDLAMLGLGLDREQQAELQEAYFHEAATWALPLEDRTRSSRLIDYFQLNMTIARLGKARKRRDPAEEIEALIDRAERLANPSSDDGSA